MEEQAPRPQVFPNRFADATGPGGISVGIDTCSCFHQLHRQEPGQGVHFHPERQDTSAPGWLHLLALIDEAAADGREVFKPLAEMSPAERQQVITLPPSIGQLTAVKRLVLYRTLRQGPLPPAALDPGLWGADAITSCSVCDSRFNERGIRQVWLSARVATDVLALLVNACSDACVDALPPGAERHIRVPLPGGPDIIQPSPR